MKKNLSKTLLLLSIIILSGTLVSFQKGKANKPKKNETIETIMKRKSVREYKDILVEDEKIDIMLRAAMAAPSGMDKRPWHFIVVQDRAVLDKMADELPYGKMLKKTQQAIVVCGDTTVSRYWYLDCAMAAQNILLAAEALELGAVFTAAYPYDDRMGAVCKSLSIPAHVLPLTIIPFGYPTEDKQPKDKYNTERIHRNKF